MNLRSDSVCTFPSVVALSNADGDTTGQEFRPVLKPPLRPSEGHVGRMHMSSSMRVRGRKNRGRPYGETTSAAGKGYEDKHLSHSLLRIKPVAV